MLQVGKMFLCEKNMKNLAVVIFFSVFVYIWGWGMTLLVLRTAVNTCKYLALDTKGKIHQYYNSIILVFTWHFSNEKLC